MRLQRELARCRATWRARQQAAATALEARRQAGRRLAAEMAAFVHAVPEVSRVWLVGSLVETERFHERFDIDLVVEGLPPERYMGILAEIYDRLPAGWELDLVRIEELSGEDGQALIARGEEIG